MGAEQREATWERPTRRETALARWGLAYALAWALALAPERVECRLLLAEIHLGAGRILLARREIEAARELGAQDDKIKVLLKRMK